MARLRYNGLSGTLGASLTNSATSVTFASKLTYVGGDVPTITGADYIPLSILDANGKCAEIVHVTAYTTAGTTATISRGKGGSSGVAHDNGRVFVNGPHSLDVTGWTGHEAILQRPLSPHADDLEFQDYSDAKAPVADLGFSWGNGGSATTEIKRGRLLMKPDSSTSANIRGLFKSAGWSADRTVTALHQGAATAQLCGPTVLLLWGTLATPTSIAMLRPYTGIGLVQAATFTSYAMGGGADRGNATFTSELPSIRATRVKYTHSGTTIEFLIHNGAAWRSLGSYNAGAAPDYYGIGLSLETTSNHSTILPAAAFHAIRHNWDPDTE